MTRSSTTIAGAARLALVLAAGAGASTPAFGQQIPPAEPDSSALVEEARAMQLDFERFREDRTPIVRGGREDARCDERIGRICIWFGGEGEALYPPELTDVVNARRDLIGFLTMANDRVADRWVLGQLVHYLVESGNFTTAEARAEECGIAEEWWCKALLGYSLHVRAAHTDAEAAFREALGAMPALERDRWMSMRYILTPEGEEAFNEGTLDERIERWELFWRLSDPLYVVQGNDRFTDHMARWVIARNQADAANPQGLERAEDPAGGQDLEATLVRYGRIMGYSRSHDPGAMFRGGLQDTRVMVGHHHPKSRGYLFPEDFVESPSEIPPESWITAPRESRTWYAPPYAPEIRGLETQISRFRRDDEMMVVGAYRPTRPDDAVASPEEWTPRDELRGQPHSALFLVPLDGSAVNFERGNDPEGVFTLFSWPGRYVSSLEVVDPAGGQAWRARQGVVQLPLEPGLLDVSDLMLLESDAPLPESLDEAIPHARRGVRVRAGERIPVVWEVYGLRVQEPVRVTLGFTRGHPGFLTRVGEFLGILEPEQPIEVSFEDLTLDFVQSDFHAVELRLPGMSPGAYTIHLRLELAGRTPIVTSRPIVIEG